MDLSSYMKYIYPLLRLRHFHFSLGESGSGSGGGGGKALLVMRKKEESPLSINCRASTVREGGRELNLMLSHRRNREGRMGSREGSIAEL